LHARRGGGREEGREPLTVQFHASRGSCAPPGEWRSWSWRRSWHQLADHDSQGICRCVRGL